LIVKNQHGHIIAIFVYIIIINRFKIACMKKLIIAVAIAFSAAYGCSTPEPTTESSADSTNMNQTDTVNRTQPNTMQQQ
jgi:hypothetical protein